MFDTCEVTVSPAIMRLIGQEASRVYVNQTMDFISNKYPTPSRNLAISIDFYVHSSALTVGCVTAFASGQQTLMFVGTDDEARLWVDEINKRCGGKLSVNAPQDKHAEREQRREKRKAERRRRRR